MSFRTFTFSERAVLQCVAELKASIISERSIRAILKCEKVNVSLLSRFLFHQESQIRMAAVRIVGEKGDVSLLLEVVKRECDKMVLFEAMKFLGKRGKNLNEIVGILETSDSMVRQEAISMFRKSGNKDCLFSLLFNEDPKIASQIREYFDE